MSQHNLTAKKADAVRLHWAGVPEVDACESAGYARPKQVAARIFERDDAGEFVDTSVAAEIDRLEGADGLTDEDLVDMDLGEIGRAALVEMANDDRGSATARVQASRELVRMSRDEQQLTPGEPCPVCEKAWHGDDEERARSEERARQKVRRLLG